MSSESVGEREHGQKLVPKLRFPEFRDDWNLVAMSDAYDLKTTNSLSRDQLNYASGSMRNIHYGDIHTKFASHFIATNERVPFVNSDVSGLIRNDNFCDAGDMVFADASEDLNDIGKAIEIVETGDLPLVAGMHTILAKPKQRLLEEGFGGFLFSSQYCRRQIQKESQGTKVLGLSPNRLRSIKLCLPQDKSEQQKIADCLSSLDAVIAAEGDRLAALKAHKKGLMQQLFPAKDQTTPRLRFPEFEGAGDWEVTTIGKVGEVTTGSTPSTAKSHFYNGDFMFVSPADISDLRFIEKTRTTLTQTGRAECRLIPERSILFVCIGSTIGKVAQCVELCATNQQINSIIPDNRFDNDFIYFLLDHESQRIAGLAGRQAVPIINKTLFSAVEISAPTISEQRCISACLSSLDDAQAAQARRLDTLKDHKKGLMQQLFPAPTQATA